MEIFLSAGSSAIAAMMKFDRAQSEFRDGDVVSARKIPPVFLEGECGAGQEATSLGGVMVKVIHNGL